METKSVLCYHIYFGLNCKNRSLKRVTWYLQETSYRYILSLNKLVILVKVVNSKGQEVNQSKKPPKRIHAQCDEWVSRLRDVLPVLESWTTSRGIKCRVGALETPLSSETWFGDRPTFDLLLHLLPLLSGQQKVYVLSGDVIAEIVLVHSKISRNLWRQWRTEMLLSCCCWDAYTNYPKGIHEINKCFNKCQNIQQKTNNAGIHYTSHGQTTRITINFKDFLLPHLYCVLW